MENERPLAMRDHGLSHGSRPHRDHTATRPGSPFSADTKALERRADAARQLVAAGQLEPELALSFVLWPSPQLVEASHTGPRSFRDRLADAMALVSEGHGQATAADMLGVGRYGIQDALRDHDLQMRLRV